MWAGRTRRLVIGEIHTIAVVGLVTPATSVRVRSPVLVAPLGAHGLVLSADSGHREGWWTGYVVPVADGGRDGPVHC